MGPRYKGVTFLIIDFNTYNNWIAGDFRDF